MANIFDRLEKQAFRAGITPRTEESRKWFAAKAKNMRNINREQLMKEDQLKSRNRTLIGGMYMFFYDPKHKDTLPYYDRFPLIIMVGKAPGGFYGLNLHYLPPKLRLKFFANLMDIQGDKRLSDNDKINITYKMLKSSTKLRPFATLLKFLYLNGRLQYFFQQQISEKQTRTKCILILERQFNERRFRSR